VLSHHALSQIDERTGTQPADSDRLGMSPQSRQFTTAWGTQGVLKGTPGYSDPVSNACKHFERRPCTVRHAAHTLHRRMRSNRHADDAPDGTGRYSRGTQGCSAAGWHACNHTEHRTQTVHRRGMKESRPTSDAQQTKILHEGGDPRRHALPTQRTGFGLGLG
jgi:hypothetical protein